MTSEIAKIKRPFLPYCTKPSPCLIYFKVLATFMNLFHPSILLTLAPRCDLLVCSVTLADYMSDSVQIQHHPQITRFALIA